MNQLNIAGFLTATSLICLMITACKTDNVSKPEQTFSNTNIWLLEKKATINYGLPDQPVSMEEAFKQGFILVYGEGLPIKNSSGPGQRRLTAERAAEVVAQRNLSHALSNGGQYGSIRFDTYSAPLKSRLTGFQIVSREYNDEQGKAVVLIKYDLRGATRFVR